MNVGHCTTYHTISFLLPFELQLSTCYLHINYICELLYCYSTNNNKQLFIITHQDQFQAAPESMFAAHIPLPTPAIQGACNEAFGWFNQLRKQNLYSSYKIVHVSVCTWVFIISTQ